jgi:hypothetical protein
MYMYVRTFRTADDDVLAGRKTGEAGVTFTFGKGLYGSTLTTQYSSSRRALNG